MKNNIKKFIVIFMSLCLIMSLSACGNQSSQTETDPAEVVAEESQNEEKANDDITVAFVVSRIAGSDLYTAVTAQMQEMADEEGVKFVTFDSQGDESRQLEGIENFIAQQVDAMIVDAINPEAVDPYIVKAMDAGIKIVASGMELLHYDTWGNVDQYLAGEYAAKSAVEFINDKLNGEATIAIINLESDANIVLRVQAFDDILSSESPKSTVVNRLPGASKEEGVTATENLLQANPEIDVIMVGNEDAALGALEAVKAMGMERDDFGIFTVNGADAAVQAIADGSVLRGTVRFQLEKIPSDLLFSAIDLAKGKEVPQSVPVEPQAITIENAKDFLQP